MIIKGLGFSVQGLGLELVGRLLVVTKEGLGFRL